MLKYVASIELTFSRTAFSSFILTPVKSIVKYFTSVSLSSIVLIEVIAAEVVVVDVEVVVVVAVVVVLVEVLVEVLIEVLVEVLVEVDVVVLVLVVVSSALLFVVVVEVEVVVVDVYVGLSVGVIGTSSAGVDDVFALTIEKCGVGRGVISKSISLFLKSASIFSIKAKDSGSTLIFPFSPS